MAELCLETIFFAQMVHQRVKVMVAERFHPAALPADKVVVGCLIDNFVKSAAGNFYPGDQMQLAKKIEGAIDGSLVDFRRFDLDQLIYLPGRQVVTLLTNGVQNQLPLRSHTIAHLAYMSNVVAVIVRHKSILLQKFAIVDYIVAENREIATDKKKTRC